MTTRIALGVEYNGARFSGWQRQASPPLPTVQGQLETALSRIANQQVAISCAGRTDAGVHATGQVIHFDTAIDRGAKAWVMGTNTHLPPEIRVQWASPVDDNFHARHSARSRRYRYVIYDQPVKPTVLVGQLTHVRQPLNVAMMHEAAQHLLGEHDFSSFRGSGCQANSPFREIRSIAVYRHNRFIIVEVEANAFLLHMVRNITGTLLQVGFARQPTDWVREVLMSRDRKKGGDTARPDGLFLVHVGYPDYPDLPQLPLGPCFL
ncbi:MAG: tRNA pseudouridine(38-40) synthase TruA [Pseudohongiella sp.]|nr:tRNA pseudouridine(38-40) synthase TruA [Pseudohongiella sp.]